jgi:predicted ATPase
MVQPVINDGGNWSAPISFKTNNIKLGDANSDGGVTITDAVGIVNSILGNASSGQQESIRIIQDMIFILCTQIDSIRFVEEPEAHIYPEAQKLLIELMVLVANHCHTQMIVTTHSPYVLSTFNNMLYYSKVLKAHPSEREELERHFLSETLNTANDEFLGINADNFEAYSLDTSREVYCQSIKDNKTRLIGDNFFDSETEKLNEDFAFLYNLM